MVPLHQESINPAQSSPSGGPVADTKWWTSLLETWTNAEDYQTWAYPILSASELLDDPKAIYVVQSAFAGSEGKHPGGDTSTDI